MACGLSLAEARILRTSKWDCGTATLGKRDMMSCFGLLWPVGAARVRERRVARVKVKKRAVVLLRGIILTLCVFVRECWSLCMLCRYLVFVYVPF